MGMGRRSAEHALAVLERAGIRGELREAEHGTQRRWNIQVEGDRWPLLTELNVIERLYAGEAATVNPWGRKEAGQGTPFCGACLEDKPDVDAEYCPECASPDGP